MEAAKHRQKALNIECSLAKCSPDDVEIRIEAAMLAATHWVNSILHTIGATTVEQDVLHTYMLTVNELRRLSIVDGKLIAMLAEIEDLRPLHVRGDALHGLRAADRAGILLLRIHNIAFAES